MANDIEMMLTRQVGRSVYSKFIVLLFLLAVLMAEVPACKIQVEIWAIFGLLYENGQSGVARSSQCEYITISSIT